MRSLIDAVKATNEGLSDGGCRKGPCVSVEFEIPLSPWQKVSPDPSVSIAKGGRFTVARVVSTCQDSKQSSGWLELRGESR